MGLPIHSLVHITTLHPFFSVIIASLSIREVFSPEVDPRPQWYASQLNELVKGFASSHALPFSAWSLWGQGALPASGISLVWIPWGVTRDDAHLSFSSTTSRFRKPGKWVGEGGRLLERNGATRGSDSSPLAGGDAIFNRLSSGWGRMRWMGCGSVEIDKQNSCEQYRPVAMLV